MKATKAHGHVSRLCQGLSAVAITVLQSAFPAAADTAPSDPQKKEAAIFAAAEKGDVATLKQLIGSGVDVDLRDVHSVSVTGNGLGSLSASVTTDTTGSGTGGGITVRSTLDEEYAETRWKAARLRTALQSTA